MAISDRAGLHIATGIASASPHEVILVEETIENSFIPYDLDHLIDDKDHDSDPPGERL